jgi:GNAT superfamily N-acetyltransferase
MRYSDVKPYIQFSTEDQYAMRERLNNGSTGMLQRWFTWNEQDKSMFWCCLAYDANNHPIGVGGVREGDRYTRRFDNRTNVYWASVFVEPQHRTKGIGRELLKRTGEAFVTFNGNRKSIVRFMDRIASKMTHFKDPNISLLSRESNPQ